MRGYLLSTMIYLLLFNGILLGQQNNFGNWLMYFGTHQVAKQWSVHSEFQYRHHTFAPINVEQFLLRTGLNYHLNKSVLVSTGFAYIGSYGFNSEENIPEAREHRFFQQLILNNKLSRLRFQHRYRLEQRWGDLGFRNRFRYQLTALLPLNKPEIKKGTFLISAFNEIFLNMEKAFFDNNRLYGALGYQATPKLQVQLGYLYQRLDDFGKGYMQVALLFNPNLLLE